MKLKNPLTYHFLVLALLSGACGSQTQNPPRNSSSSGNNTAGSSNTGSTPQPLPSVLPTPTSGELVLNIGQIFDQGQTQWCWAFSAFHVLRTHYSNPQQSDQAWKTTLQGIDSQQGFVQYLKNVGTNEQMTGDPIWFVEKLEQDFNLTRRNWTTLFSANDPSLQSRISDYKSYGYLSEGKNPAEIVTEIKTQIERKSPVAYCDVQHCVFIYGVTLENNQVKSFHVGDSMGSNSKFKTALYKLEAQTLIAEIDLVMLLK